MCSRVDGSDARWGAWLGEIVKGADGGGGGSSGGGGGGGGGGGSGGGVEVSVITITCKDNYRVPGVFVGAVGGGQQVGRVVVVIVGCWCAGSVLLVSWRNSWGFQRTGSVCYG